MTTGARSPSLSVVIPVFNGARTLPPLVERLTPVLDAVADRAEILLVNDGSTDESWAVICRLVRTHSRVCGINLMRNYGQHNALLCGIRSAACEVVVTMDDDLEHPPEEICKLLEVLSRGYDVAYGTPHREQHGFWRNIASRITKLALQTTMGAQTARNVSAFRAFRTPVRESFRNYQGSFVSIDVLLTWGTTKFSSTAVRHEPRAVGESSYTFRKLVTHALNMMTGFSVVPLQIASLMGFASALFGALIFLYVLGRYVIQGGSVPGFPFLASIIAIFSGVQLLAVGVIGEYLARMHFRMMDRPTYVVRQETVNRDRVV